MPTLLPLSVSLYQHILNPKTFLIDYEQAARSATEKVLPNTSVKGCFYHLSQNIYDKVQYEGLQGKYQVDADFALNIRMLPALAFIPQDEVVDAFETQPTEGDPVIDYLEDTYIGCLQGWHNHMLVNIISFHPKIWKFLLVLTKEQALTNITINQKTAEDPAPPSWKRYKDSTARIASIVRDFEKHHVLSLLRGIAHSLHLSV
ncbi:hypothetical protein Hamer_G030700 [Homarus americanus]|uniref:MULE transposase domain-containing protein n=1 Tax=Homarus americanus TaxID=6706 RepID=A0A8J5JGU1_HOMAM|nr:hypothetical protein Hamer_G019800 [Homarus americanus]KAG7174684.1 hypothetical protein Hamer_G030700 [Homarus americanus]